MSGKKVTFGGKPGRAETSEEWVSAGKDPVRTTAMEPMKRLTLDIPETLHRRIKAGAATRGKKIVEEIREILEREYPG